MITMPNEQIRHVASYVGLVPGERSSSDRERRTDITKRDRQRSTGASQRRDATVGRRGGTAPWQVHGVRPSALTGNDSSSESCPEAVIAYARGRSIRPRLVDCDPPTDFKLCAAERGYSIETARRSILIGQRFRPAQICAVRPLDGATERRSDGARTCATRTLARYGRCHLLREERRGAYPTKLGTASLRSISSSSSRLRTTAYSPPLTMTSAARGRVL